MTAPGPARLHQPSRQPEEDGGPREDQTLRAGDLGPQHHGWLIRIPRGTTPPEDSLLPPVRSIMLLGVRTWEYNGEALAGLMGDCEGPWRGQEYLVSADAEVRLQYKIRRGVPRLRQSDYPEATR